MTPVLLFSAPSGSGKTTFIQSFIPYLTKNGLKIGYIKHHHGEFYENEKKDTGKMLEAGASKTLLIARDVIVTEEIPVKHSDLLRHYVNSRFSEYHLVIIEGFKENKEYPKIIVLGNPLRNSEGWFSERKQDKNIIAIISNDNIYVPYPVFSFGDKEKLSDFIIEFFKLREE